MRLTHAESQLALVPEMPSCPSIHKTRAIAGPPLNMFSYSGLQKSATVQLHVVIKCVCVRICVFVWTYVHPQGDVDKCSEMFI